MFIFQKLENPFLWALLLSLGLHMAFFVRFESPSPEFKTQSPSSIALKLGTSALPKKVFNKDNPPLEKDVLTTKALKAQSRLAPKPEKIIEPEVKPEGEVEQIMVTREARFSSAPIPPVYPEQARRERQEGLVMVRAQVDASGKTQAVQIARSSGFVLLDQSALDAVAQWAFLPAQQNEKNITAWIEVPIDFKLR